MEFYIKVMFWVLFLDVVAKLINIGNEGYKEPVSLHVKVVDTLVTAIFVIWAGFVLWY